jgi:hypothetical protein
MYVITPTNPPYFVHSTKVQPLNAYLKGAKPADLPVEVVVHPELIVNPSLSTSALQT